MKDDSLSVRKWIVIALSVSVLMMLIYYLTLDTSTWTGSVSDLGTVGDFFGGVLNPIFAFLSFIFLVVTIGLQREELKESRKQTIASNNELMLSREEMEKSSKALSMQADVLKVQQFENTFFNLLDKYERSLRSLLGKEIHSIDDLISVHVEIYEKTKDESKLIATFYNPVTSLMVINNLILCEFPINSDMKKKFFSIVGMNLSIKERKLYDLLMTFKQEIDLNFLKSFSTKSRLNDF